MVHFHDVCAVEISNLDRIFVLSLKQSRCASCYVFCSGLLLEMYCHVITLCVCVIQEVSEVMEQQRHLMKCVLEDTRLNRLRLEGGTVLARIRKEEACDNENYRYRRRK